MASPYMLAHKTRTLKKSPPPTPCKKQFKDKPPNPALRVAGKQSCLVTRGELARFPHLGKLHVDGASADLGLVHGGERSACSILLCVGDEAETPAAASLTVVDNVGLSDGAELSEHL